MEYHYFHESNITVPRQMLDVLKGLSARDMRVFNVEPNYWWANWAQEFMEFAYIQVSFHNTSWPIYASSIICKSRALIVCMVYRLWVSL